MNKQVCRVCFTKFRSMQLKKTPDPRTPSHSSRPIQPARKDHSLLIAEKHKILISRIKLRCLHNQTHVVNIRIDRVRPHPLSLLQSNIRQVNSQHKTCNTFGCTLVLTPEIVCKRNKRSVKTTN